MKISFTLLLFFAYALSSYPQVYCPPNTPLGSTIQEWNWTQNTYRLYYTDGFNQNPFGYVIESPFYDGSPNGAPNTAQYAFYTTPDYLPGDGWELLYQNFGGPANGPGGSVYTEYVAVPSFALYNRYSGTIRAFSYIPTNNSSAFDIVTLSVGHQTINEEAQFENGTALFSFLETPSKALDNFEPIQNMAQSYNLYVNGGVWTVAEFVTAYDPCICDHPSSIFIEPTFRDSQSVTLNFTGTGTTTPIIQNGTPASGLQTGISTATNALGILGSGLMNFNSLNDYYSKVNEITGVDGDPDAPYDDLSPIFGNSLTVLKNLLPGWVSTGQTVVRLLRFFVGSNGMATQPRITGYSSTFNLEGSGSIINDQVGNPSTIWTPNSEAQNNPIYQSGSDPVYGNALGVFNLIETPIVEFYSNTNPGAIDRSYDQYYQLKEDIKYVINTSAGIDLIPDRIMLALAFEDCSGTGSRMGLLPASEGGIVRTPLIDAACFLDQKVNFFGEFVGTGFDDFREHRCDGEISLQVFAVLSPSDGTDETVFMGSFGVSSEVGQSFTAGNNYFPDLGFSNDQQAASGCNEPILLPVTESELSLFCSTVYDPTSALVDMDSTLEQRSADLDSDNIKFQNVSPNVTPVNNLVRTQLKLSVENLQTPLDFSIMSTNGRRVAQFEILPSGTKAFDHVFKLPDLPAGLYICNMNGKSYRKTFKIFKND